LLPNPYRLIVDIHGASVRGGSKVTVAAAQMTEVPVALADAARANAAANLSGLPAMAATKLEGAQPSLEEAQPTLEEAPAPAPAPRVAAAFTPAAIPVPVASDATLPVAPKRRKKGAKDAAAAQAAQAAAPAKAADPTADGETSLVRALGLKVNRIVIDAGHGGHDSGTIGADGIEEKDVVLDVALRVGKLLHDRLGAEIVYTRSDDTFIPLETRTAIANKAQADLFLSIHANSSQDDSARGVEVYYLNFTSDPAALEVAARENAVSGESVHQLSDLVKKIALKNKISESREFAGDVEASLYGGLAKGNDGLKNRGVKKAPFVVLIGANMPSILAEISFVTNPKDAAQLRRPEYRERVAESLFNGVARYENGLGGAKPVQPVTRASIQ
jgi:N-acetylmuramoyl-L-alanine amidase